ncbi:bifunctional polysaccharide deacetylase/glycosyltransferase family 2 protein [Blastococcus sp. SYSU DS0617]
MNPSGRRWRRLRAAGLVVLAFLATVVAVGAPRLLAPPALPGASPPEGPRVAEIGEPPVTGTGPLVRVLELLRVGSAVYAQEPFTGQVVTRLGARAIAEVGDARYIVQRYGYAESAHRTLSLTFDDGPDPVWTPRLLDMLSALEVPATFFVTGEEMVKYPEIMRRIVREGFALGNHSLTHIDVNTTTGLRAQAEVVMTDRIMQAQTGYRTDLFRLPYDGADDRSLTGAAPGIMRAQQLGYLVATHDFDTQDWAYASGQRSGEIPMPPLGDVDNITVLLHDAGGGDRSRTLAYVEDLVAEARAAGYTFHSMPQVLPEADSRAGPTEVSVEDRVALYLGFTAFALPGPLLVVLFVFAVVTMLGLGLLNTTLAVVRRRRRRRPVSTDRPPVAVLIAAFNEEVVLARTVRHVLQSSYPVREVVVVDDGSTDGTAAVVEEIAAADSRVRLIRQPNAGKWAALNRGFAAIEQPFVVTLDADTLFTPDTVGRLMEQFHSPRVGAVAGVIKVGNYARNIVTRWQALEYVTQIGVDRAAAALLDAVMIVPGACAAWRREAVLACGGYRDATLAEDCDLTLALHRHGWSVEQADEATAWTEAPETVDALLKQRVRWMHGTLQAVWAHRAMLLRPRYGWLGMLVMPMAVLTVVLPLVFIPFITVVVLQMLVAQGPLMVLLYFAAFALFYGLLAAVAVRLLHERPAHLLMVPLYRFIYEPLRAYLLYASLGTALRGVRLGWNKLARTAHMDEVAEPGVVAA